jgi:hypothetical protein
MTRELRSLGALELRPIVDVGDAVVVGVFRVVLGDLAVARFWLASRAEAITAATTEASRIATLAWSWCGRSR